MGKSMGTSRSAPRRRIPQSPNLAESDPTSGVREIKITEFYDDRAEDAEIWYQSEVRNFRQLNQSQLPPGMTLGYVSKNGVSFTCKTLSSMEELALLTDANTLVNASGLGAKILASDETILGIRGQTMFVKTDKLDEAMIIQGSQYTYVIPRASDGGVILGGVTQPGDSRVHPDLSLRSDILTRVNSTINGTFSTLDLNRDVVKDIVGFRPSRIGGIRVERVGNVVHAYGFSGLGYLFAFGAAKKVRDLILQTPVLAKL
ncbi:hypothetical protein AK830_g2731 [Neonectria ditissima]|uniref:FAD dependent oxidoreductase domain-containing protein n=1 Tax=Neonectria ditissima TaxID=78410 RepID=A0A0P7BJ93_9HYPO|nr:hypothetical protein AK830_g2731 [Neonectria ditissima]